MLHILSGAHFCCPCFWHGVAYCRSAVFYVCVIVKNWVYIPQDILPYGNARTIHQTSAFWSSNVSHTVYWKVCFNTEIGDRAIILLLFHKYCRYWVLLLYSLWYYFVLLFFNCHLQCYFVGEASMLLWKLSRMWRSIRKQHVWRSMSWRRSMKRILTTNCKFCCACKTNSVIGFGETFLEYFKSLS